MDLLLNTLSKFCFTQKTHATFWIGLSGGLDSSVLLHLLASVRDQRFLKLRAVHIHHGLSPNADEWQTHCMNLCRHLQIDMEVYSLNIPSSSKKSLEDLARQMRYQQLSSLLNEDDMLLTAHHQDDQAETVLLQLLRGAGPKGLSAMPLIKPLGKGFHVRPLLNFSRADLEHYAKENNLNWIDDESNDKSRFTRNFLRNEIFPLLKKRWPSVTATLARTAENCAATQALVDQVVNGELEKVRGVVKHTLCVSKLLKLDPSTQCLLLRGWIHELDFPTPSAIKLKEIQKTVLSARQDKLPCVSWGEVEVRRFQDALYIMQKQSPHDPTMRLPWNRIDPLVLPGIGILPAFDIPGLKLENGENITVRFRQGGEVIRIRGKQRTLKNLFQEWKIPPWERDRIPLIYKEEKLVAVVGLGIADDGSNQINTR